VARKWCDVQVAVQPVSVLAPIPKELTFPEDVAPLSPPRSSQSLAGRVEIGDSDEHFQVIPARYGDLVPYDALPLPTRGPLILRASVIDRLDTAALSLPEPFSLAVLDGWRSPQYQAKLMSYYVSLHPSLDDGYVADPNDSLVLPPHTTGGAVDLTLSWNGIPLALGTDYDSFHDEAHLMWLEENAQRDTTARNLRRLLARALRGAGFAPYPMEWWHWSFGDQWWAAEYGFETSLFPRAERPEL